MKKILLLIILCLFVFSGCEKNNNPDSIKNDSENIQNSTESDTKNVSSSTENDTSDTINNQEPESTASQDQELSMSEHDGSSTYYKLEVTPVDYDVEALLQYLIPDYDESLVRQEENALETSFVLELDSVTHTWFYGKEIFTYFNNSASGQTLTEEEALAYGDDFIRHFGYEVTEEPDIKKENDGSYSITYNFQYEGVPVLGNGGISLKNGDEENDFANGEYIEVLVNGNGIRGVYLNYLYEAVTVLEEYQEDDLIDSDKLDSIVSFAMNAFFQGMGDDVERSFQTKKVSLIYIPWQENGMQLLLPAFRVDEIIFEHGEDFENELAISQFIDAVSGYVYQ